jgi:hypothetical protein
MATTELQNACSACYDALNKGFANTLFHKQAVVRHVTGGFDQKMHDDWIAELGPLVEKQIMPALQRVGAKDGYSHSTVEVDKKLLLEQLMPAVRQITDLVDIRMDEEKLRDPMHDLMSAACKVVNTLQAKGVSR